MILNYRNVEIHVDDRLRADRPLLDLIRDYVDARFRRPVVLYRRWMRGRFLRFAIPEELLVPIPGASIAEVPLDDCFGTIVCLNGCALTDADCDDARRLFWYEPVYVEMAPDGTPWIDD